MADKEINVKFAVNVDDNEVQGLEKRLAELKNKQLHTKLDVDTGKLNEVNTEIETVKTKIKTLQGKADVDDAEIKSLEAELQQLEAKKIDLEVKVSQDELKIAQQEAKELDSKLDAIDDDVITPQVNNISAMEGIQQLADGFSRVKQGATELGQQIGGVLESAGKQETNKAFLTNALGGDVEKANQSVDKINGIIQKLPGDDTALQGLLSSAVGKDSSSMLAENGKQLDLMANNAVDYFQAMAYYGKPAIEAQQDLNNYLMTGMTSEIERSPILAGHVDELKKASTIQERNVALQKALNEEGWGGMGQADTYNNKLETFNGMLERGRYNLGGMFQEGAKGAMDFILKMDEASGGLVGMGIALGGMASPLTDMLFGLGQMATGINALKGLGFIKWLKDLEIANKLAKISQLELNFAFLTNPVFILVTALIVLIGVLVWAYYNVDWFREMVDNAFASLVQLGQQIYNAVIPVIQWLSNLFQQFTAQLGLNTNDWAQAIIGFIAFIPSLPLQVGIALTNTIARALGFKGNFVATLLQTALEGVQNFANAIMGIPQALENCLNWAYNVIMNNPIVQALQWLGEQASRAFSVLGLGQSSPGKIVKAMRQELEWTQEAVEDSDLASSTAKLGANVSGSFNPNLDTMNGDVGTLNTGSFGQVNNIYISDIVVDNDDRVDRLCTEIARRINWDNTTAGRTV